MTSSGQTGQRLLHPQGSPGTWLLPLVIKTLFNGELVCTVCSQSLRFYGKCFPFYIQTVNWR